MRAFTKKISVEDMGTALRFAMRDVTIQGLSMEGGIASFQEEHKNMHEEFAEIVCELSLKGLGIDKDLAYKCARIFGGSPKKRLAKAVAYLTETQ